jgi:Na+-translocating ferredoxin:NAD+ oxidoreductase RnfE subunit
MPEQNHNASVITPQQGTELHRRIDLMLTEARVILPGAQALLGFQFIVTLTTVFEKLPPHVRVIHFVALCAVTLATILLIAPAAIHRMTFHGKDSESFHRLGSFIVTLALVPLIMGMSADAYVAGGRILNSETIGIAMGLSTLAVLVSLWYVTPLVLRRRYA